MIDVSYGLRQKKVAPFCLVILLLCSSLLRGISAIELRVQGNKSTKKTKLKKIHAGILPYFYDTSGKAYFLLGKDNEDQWADLAGAWKEEDGKDYKKTAIRTFNQESRLVFGKFHTGIRPLEEKIDREEFSRLQNKSGEYIATRLSHEFIDPKSMHVMYLAPVDFVPADTFINAATVPNYTTISYAWIPVEEFMESMKKIQNRWHATYRNKQIKRYLYDIFHERHADIMNIVYPLKTQNQNNKLT